MGAAHGLGADDCILMPAPCAHISGLLNGITLPGAVPFRSILMPRWDPDRALDIIESQRVTFMVGPPTFFRGLMDAPSFDADTGRVAALDLERRRRRERGVRRGGRGAARRAGQAHVRVDRGTDRRHRRRSRSPRPSSELAPNGELLVRGPEVCVGYLDPRDNDDAFTADGWFRTGDLATIDDGQIEIVGRTKDVIIRGGENISTAEVEARARSPPGGPARGRRRLSRRADGRAARGVRRHRRDRSTSTTRRAWFAERGVAKFKTPERVLVVPELPLLATGKPDRAALRRAVVPG